MQYHLEKKILLKENPENKSLYTWALEEVDEQNIPTGSDQIPWPWSLYFTASDFRYIYSVEKKASGNEHKNVKTDLQEIIEEERLFAILRSGISKYDDEEKDLEQSVSYSMFGTDRIISHFELNIRKSKTEDNEFCHMWGWVSCTSEHDFEAKTEDDMVGIDIYVSPYRFDKIAKLIKTGQINKLNLRLSDVAGFYSEWSQNIKVNDIKILTNDEEHKVFQSEKCSRSFPRLGKVNAFSISLSTCNISYLKLYHQTIDADKIFNNSNVSQDKIQDDMPLMLQSQLSRNEATIANLYIPLGLIFIALCFLLFRH